MENIGEDVKVEAGTVKTEASQKAMKAILALSVVTILLITYGVISFITTFANL